MTDKDTITLPRKHIDHAAHALEHFNKNAPDPLVSEIIHHLRTALAAEQPSEEAEALRREIERLRGLLTEAKDLAWAFGADSLRDRINAALRREET